MKIIAEWSQSDVNYTMELLSEYSGSDYHRTVRAKNLAVPWVRPSDDEIWDLHVQCMLTSQQPSGDGSVIDRTFKNVEYGESDLSIGNLAGVKDRHAHVAGFLRKNGFRMWERRTSWICDNYSTFVDSGTCRMLEACAPRLLKHRCGARGLERKPLLELERAAAKVLAFGDPKVKGIGPKQARHFLKQVGLSVHTTPVDSRLMNFLWKVLDAPDDAGPWTGALGDEYTVRMLENWFGDLAQKVGITPVELDTIIWEANEK